VRISELEASLVYRGNSRTVRAIQRNTTSQNNNNKSNKQNKTKQKEQAESWVQWPKSIIPAAQRIEANHRLVWYIRAGSRLAWGIS
jgi:PAB1-binding protein PBP1